MIIGSNNRFFFFLHQEHLANFLLPLRQEKIRKISVPSLLCVSVPPW